MRVSLLASSILACSGSAAVISGRPRRRGEDHPRVLKPCAKWFAPYTALGGDMDALMEILAPDVTLWTDGGGRVKASTLRPVHGRGKVARLINSVAARPSGQDLQIRHRTVNGDPSALLFADDAPFAVMVLDLSPDGDKVPGIYAVTNPDKLTHVQTHEDEGDEP